MKKNYTKSLLAITTILLFVCTTSCSSDDDTSIENKKSSTLLTSTIANDYKIDYSYDSHNRLIKISESYLNSVNDTDSTNIVYDNHGRITQTIYHRNYKETNEKGIKNFMYSEDSIFIIDNLNTQVDTLTVINNKLIERRSRQYVTQYSYDDNGNLTQSDEKEINNPNYIYRAIYNYDRSEKGLIQDAKTPAWFVILYNQLNIYYSENLCTSYNLYDIKIENGIESDPNNTSMYIISYENEDGKPIKMTETKIKYDEIYTYSFEYIKK